MKRSIHEKPPEIDPRTGGPVYKPDPKPSKRAHVHPPEDDDPGKIYGLYDVVPPAAKRPVLPDRVFDPSKPLTGFDYASDQSVRYLIEAEQTYVELARRGYDVIKERVNLLIFLCTMAIQASARKKALGFSQTANDPDALNEGDMSSLDQRRLEFLAGRKRDGEHDA